MSRATKKPVGRVLNPDCFNEWVYRGIDDYSHAVEVYMGGAGSGKSYGALQKILLKAVNRKRKVLIVRKVAATLRDSVFSLFRQILADSGYARFATVNKTDYSVELANGSYFIFRGLDDNEKIKSINGLTDIVVEEATEITKDDFTQLRLRLRTLDEDKQVILMFNPISKVNWVYGYFFESCPADCVVYKTTYEDNRFLPPEYREVLEGLKITNPAYYRIYALGEFATLDKLVFPNYEKRVVSDGEVKGLPLFVGLDFGYVNDPSAVIWGRYDGAKKVIYVLGEFFEKGLLNDALAALIKDLGLAKEVIIADSAEQKSIDDLRRMGITRIRGAEKGPGSILFGLNFISMHKLVVDSRCVGFVEELQNYAWQKDRASGQYTNVPVDAYNHGIDALRYGLSAFTREHRVKVRPLGVLSKFLF